MYSTAGKWCTVHNNRRLCIEYTNRLCIGYTEYIGDCVQEIVYSIY